MAYVGSFASCSSRILSESDLAETRPSEAIVVMARTYFRTGFPNLEACRIEGIGLARALFTDNGQSFEG